MCLHAETELGEPHPPQPSFQLLDGTAFTLAASFHNAPGPGGGGGGGALTFRTDRGVWPANLKPYTLKYLSG